VNHYGRMARAHWRTVAPHRFAALPASDIFFATLGERVSDRVSILIDEQMQSAPAWESPAAHASRFAVAERNAVETAMIDLVWIESESDL
jgi:hypothetical protein